MAFKYTVKKGETLGGIANQFGFRNFKDAGISSVKSGNFDNISEGEQIVLENYDPNKIRTSGANTPIVISSGDNAQAFTENRNKLENILAGSKAEDDTTIDTEDKKDEEPFKFTGATRRIDYSTGSPVTIEIDPFTGKDVVPSTDTTKVDGVDGEDIKTTDPFTISRQDDRAKIDIATENMINDSVDYISSINTKLANIDSATKSSVDRIRASSQRRIKEQTRINNINIDRVKALGVGTATYKPIQFSDAVTEREREASEEISILERDRDLLITEAENASVTGQSDLLDEKLEGINDIEKTLRERLTAIEEESDKQYKLLVEVRTEREAEDEKNREEIVNNISAFVSANKEDYEDLPPEELEKQISDLIKQTNLSYSEIYNAIIGGIETDIKLQKTKAEIAGIKARTKKTIKETEEVGDEEEDKFSTTQKQDLERAGLTNAERKQKLDFLRGFAKGDVDVYDFQGYAENADIGDIVILNGERYKKVAEDDFDLVK